MFLPKQIVLAQVRLILKLEKISTDLITEDVSGATDISPTAALSKDIEIKSDGSYKISGNIDLGAYQLKVVKSLTNVVLYFNGSNSNKIYW